MFANRTVAGRRLATALADLSLDHPVVYALPRGGVPVAAEIADRLPAPLDLLMVRKIGAPLQPELALGAVVDGSHPVIVRNEDVIALYGVDEAAFAALAEKELAEIRRRRALYLAGRESVSPAGRTAVVVDDGLATGATAKAAVKALRAAGAARIVLAVPVAPTETVAAFADLVDDVVCLEQADFFPGVGAFYGEFPQLTDGEVIEFLKERRLPKLERG
jgi:putative phosphoribosyl transferase